MICSANSSLSNPLESCNRAPLILLPAFLPLNRSRWPLYLHPPSTNFPQIIPLLSLPSISPRPSLVTHCSEISPTLPLSCQPYLNQTPFAVSEPSGGSGEFTLFESRSREIKNKKKKKEKKRKKKIRSPLPSSLRFPPFLGCYLLAWVALRYPPPTPNSDQSSNEKVCIPLAWRGRGKSFLRLSALFRFREEGKTGLGNGFDLSKPVAKSINYEIEGGGSEGKDLPLRNNTIANVHPSVPRGTRRFCRDSIHHRGDKLQVPLDGDDPFSTTLSVFPSLELYRRSA